jgi:hypothetical protein
MKESNTRVRRICLLAMMSAMAMVSLSLAESGGRHIASVTQKYSAIEGINIVDQNSEAPKGPPNPPPPATPRPRPNPFPRPTPP